jgi:hypothetical protein
MSTARYILDPNSWSKLVEYLYPNSKKRQSGSSAPIGDTAPAPIGDTAKVHCHIPICIGYKDKVKLDELIAVINAIEYWGYSWTIYLAPKDEKALLNWESEHADFIKKYSGKVLRISKWRESEAWQTASTRYTALREGPQKATLAERLSDDVKNFWDRHKDLPVREVKDHIIQEVKDCISWMTPLDAKGEDADRVNVLMYKSDITQSMFEAFQNAVKLGYKSGLIHSKYSIKQNPDFKEDSPSAPQPSDSIPIVQPKSDPSAETPEHAFERAFAFVAKQGKGHNIDIDSSAQLLLRMHALEKEKSSPSSSPENKFAAGVSREKSRDDLVAMPLDSSQDAVADDLTTEKKDAGRVVNFKQSEALARQGILPAPQKDSPPRPSAPGSSAPRPSGSSGST